MAAMTDTTAPTLYQTIGGAPVLREMVDRFYDLMELEPEFAGIRTMHPGSTEGSRDKLYFFQIGRASCRERVF